MSTLTPLASSFPLKPLRFMAPLRGEKVDAVPLEGEFLGLEQFESWSGKLSGVELQQPPEGGANVFNTGDVLFGKLRPYLAKGWVADRPGYCTTEGLVLAPSGSDARFVRYCLLTHEVISAVDGSTYGSKMPRADWRFIGGVHLPCPSQDKQERIANFLDDKTARIDALIAEKERLADSLKDIEEVTAFDMVTRGLTPDVRRIKFTEPWLQEVPSHWRLSKVRQIASVGNGSTPKRDHDPYWIDGKTPWLNSGSVNAARISEASDFVTELAQKDCHLPMVRAGSTVVALTGQGKTRGTASLTEFETTINQHLAYVSLFDSRMTDEYLWVALTGFYSVLRYLSDGEGSTKGALTCEQLNRFRLPVPPPDEQADIVKAYIDRNQAIDGLKAHAIEHITRLREYRSSLISAAVTGQLDVGTFKGAR